MFATGRFPESVDGLPLPRELLDLIRSGHWPTTHDQFWKQEWSHHPPIPHERVQRLADGETMICLTVPPFPTVAKLHAGREVDFWTHPMAAAGEIDMAKSILIGDFGLGSDSPLLLDYRYTLSQPSVLRLKWGGALFDVATREHICNNHWVVAAETFGRFVEVLDLWNVSFA